MASIDDLPLTTRLFLKTYRWRRIDPVPSAKLATPLAAARIAVVTSAGLTLPDQPPFEEHHRGGDSSWREIPGDVDVSTLVETHRSASFDHAGIAADRNLGMPLDRLRELHREGFVGPPNHRHFSVMGSITATGRFVRDTAPRIATMLREDGVDGVLLVPV